MRRTLLFGVAAAVLYAVVTIVGSVVGLSFTNVAVGNVLVGIAAGTALALVRVGSPAARAGAFLVGYFVTIVFYLIRVGLLPTNAAGLVVFGSACLLVISVISALTRGRLPLFAMMIGVIVFSGTMEAPFNNQPWYLLNTLPQIMTGLLVPVAAGFLTVMLVEWREPAASALVAPGGGQPVDPGQVSGGVPGDALAGVPAQANAGLEVLGGSNGGNDL